MKYERILSTRLKKAKKSILLIGPRQTGKSTLIRSLKPDLTFNLARESTFLEFSSQPDLLENILTQRKVRSVFIDEVQRIPSLLNSIQAMLDEGNLDVRFYLTGSSARKLKRGQANLLPGRVVNYYLSPLALREVEFEYSLDQALSTGMLPGIFTEHDQDSREEVLNSYGGTYLKEEIQAEALTKNIEGFSRFLFVVAAKNGEFLDYAKLGREAQIDQKTATRFFEILEDTLLVSRLDAFSQNDFRRVVRHPKFYFFDLGVLNALLGNFHVTADRIGMLFETFVVQQVRTLALATGKTFQFSTYRTEAGAEVDLIIQQGERLWAIEIKASKNIGSSDLRGFKSFSEIYLKPHHKRVIYLGKHTQSIQDVSVSPLEESLRELEIEFSH